MLKPAFIDLSHHNVIPESLSQAKEAGILGLIHKATEGNSFVDWKLESRCYLAREVGMLWGVYHFIRPGGMARQADHFLRAIGDVIDDNTLLCLDYEDPGVDLEDVRFWMEYVESRTNRSPVLYSGHVLKDSIAFGQDASHLTKYRLWLAQYSSTYSLPKGWDKFWGWQYSDKGTVPGIDPPTDVNAYWSDYPYQFSLEWSGAFRRGEGK